MRVLTPSRKKLRLGDVFAMGIPDGEFMFGRVISDKADIGFKTFNSYVLYVYSVRSLVKELPERRELRPDRLLIPPVIVSRLGWSRGYMETIANLPLDDEDVPKTLCFRKYDDVYVDEVGRVLSGPVEPVGSYGLGNYLTMDDKISAALGMPSAAE